jgi:hypothetical protein
MNFIHGLDNQFHLQDMVIFTEVNMLGFVICVIFITFDFGSIIWSECNKSDIIEY